MRKRNVFTRQRRTVVSRAGLGVLIAISGVVGCAAPAAAQLVPGAIAPGHDRPSPAIPTQPDFDFSIIAPHRSPVPRAVDEVHFKLADIKIDGAVTIPPAQFRPLYEQLLGKDVTLGDILTVAEKVEAQYRAEGYLLVRAYVPPQKVSDGVFTINVVEGYISELSVQGGDEETRPLIKKYLEPAQNSRPLRLAEMERGLLMANDIPGVAATGVLRPSPDTKGASDLVVDTVQPWLSGGLAADNRGSHFSGIWTVVGDVEVNSIFGADQLAATVTVSPSSFEQAAGQLRYRRAVGDDGLIGTLVGSYTHGQPGSTLTAFNVLTDSWAVGPRLTYPVIRTRSETLLLDGGFTVQDARVGLLGTGFSHDKWRVLDIGGSYQRAHVLGGVWTVTFDIAQGLPFLDASPNHSPLLSRAGGVTDFTKINAFTRLALPLFGAVSMVVSAQGQYSFAPLITGEQITFGGTELGRGYDPGALTGDHGVGGSLELRDDFHFANFVVRNLQPYVYVDAAQTWYKNSSVPVFPPLLGHSITSVGGGLRFWLPYNMTITTEVAHTLTAVPGSDDGRRATKILVDLSVRF